MLPALISVATGGSQRAIALAGPANATTAASSAARRIATKAGKGSAHSGAPAWTKAGL